MLWSVPSNRLSRLSEHTLQTCVGHQLHLDEIMKGHAAPAALVNALAPYSTCVMRTQTARPRVCFACAAALAMLTEGHPEICAQIEACNGIQALVAPLPLPPTFKHRLLCRRVLGACMCRQLQTSLLCKSPPLSELGGHSSASLAVEQLLSALACRLARDAVFVLGGTCASYSALSTGHWTLQSGAAMWGVDRPGQDQMVQPVR